MTRARRYSVDSIGRVLGCFLVLFSWLTQGLSYVSQDYGIYVQTYAILIFLLVVDHPPTYDPYPFHIGLQVLSPKSVQAGRNL